MNLLLFFLLAVQIHSVAPVIHTLKCFYTASSEVTNFPDYVEVIYADEIEVYYYDSDSRTAERKQDWMNNITVDDPHFWQRHTDNAFIREDRIKYYTTFCMEIFNQTEGVHILQVMPGCEWDDETDEVKGWLQTAYDGEDLMSLDVKTWTMIPARPQAVPIKRKWEEDRFLQNYGKFFYTVLCPYYLKNLAKYGRKVLMRTELPEVFLLQKTPSSPVSCFATGFYPDRAALFWRKDGEEVHEDVEHGEILPNHDGTFQLTVNLNVEVTADVEGKYECVFQLSGVEEDMVTKLERRSILSNASHEDNWSVDIAAIVGVLAVVVLLVAIIIIIIIVKRHKNRQGCKSAAVFDLTLMSFQPNTQRSTETEHTLLHRNARDGGNELSERMTTES
ncbi:class I histocompatibility antigen, F10 alpha chain-like isoform X3 [Dunckerocampus dactyliophorus]|uniref:class I histocompatibility antigen, F10 alpha chain-like isoform X3 n=1 Tax=Dunckerocampus dactyliophorus TaxID=161453 RepID=UPI002405B962|nr:class I histocompatibility antigen, F10 alpha chain-like isoform X3 [Dunckerocampus dactyliophorus]